MSSLPQVETLIKDARSLEKVEPPYRVFWEDSGEYTQFLLKWNARPKVFSITQVFSDEMRRRRGLLAYGIRATAKRRSKVNQLATAASALRPRFNQLDTKVANAAAA
jgi:hypothetical protein